MDYKKFQKIIVNVISNLKGKFGFYVDIHYPKAIDKLKTDYSKIEYNNEPDIANETMLVQNLFNTDGGMGNIPYIDIDNDEQVKLLVDGLVFEKIVDHSLVVIKSGDSVYQYIVDKFNPKLFGDGDNQAVLYAYIYLKPYSAKDFVSDTINEANQVSMEKLEEKYENIEEFDLVDNMATEENLNTLENSTENNDKFYDY